MKVSSSVNNLIPPETTNLISAYNLSPLYPAGLADEEEAGGLADEECSLLLHRRMGKQVTDDESQC